MTFAGETVLVTGGTRGIGRAIASSFARMGAWVAITGRNQAKTEEVAHEMSEELVCEHPVMGIAMDVADPLSVAPAMAKLKEWRPDLDVLVNNAGITRDQLIMRMKDEDWDAVLATNLTGAFHMCKAAVRGMMKKRKGRIINISSVVGVMGNAGQTNYVASKAGLIGFTKALAREVGSRGITVNAIAPGFIQTQMTEELTGEASEKLLASVPLGRPGMPEDVAAAALFLASEGGSYVTGQVIHVDGGMVMQ